MEKIPLARIELDWCANFVLICKCYVRYKIACFLYLTCRYWHRVNEERLPELSRFWVVQNKVATLRENKLPYPLLVANTVKPLSRGPPIERTPSIKRTLILVPKRTSDISFYNEPLAIQRTPFYFVPFCGLWRPQILPYWRSCNEKLVDAHEVTSNHDVMAGSERNMLIMFYWQKL